MTSPGFMDDKTALNTHSLSHQPELPDRTMQMGTDEIQGTVLSLELGGEKTTLWIKKDDGSVETIVTSPESLHHHGKEMPKRGDSIRCVLGDDGTLQDYEITHDEEEGLGSAEQS